MSIPAWARVGVKVVCIDDTAREYVVDGVRYRDDSGTFPVVGQVYTIASVEDYTSPIECLGSWIGVHLVELKRPPGIISGRVVPYRLSRFRPLVEDSEDDGLEARLFRESGKSVKAPAAPRITVTADRRVE